MCFQAFLHIYHTYRSFAKEMYERFSGLDPGCGMDNGYAGKLQHPQLPEPGEGGLPALINMSGVPEQEYIGDGLSQNITGAFSRISELFVIARNSTFTCKGRP
jgi:hypothetical protein